MKKNSYVTVTDQFCGAGGSSQGVRNVSQRIKGVEVKLALNHWKLAIETHNTNFPNTLHDCTDISASDPRRYPSTDILITSPECTNHSLAKGEKAIKAQMDLFASGKENAAAERSRATMWDVTRFAEYHKYNIIIVENVVDARKWVMWDSWLHAMHALGYNHKAVYMNSMHAHPTPQSRDRMYVVFWRKGNKAPMLEYTPVAHCGICNKNVNSIQSWKRPDVNFGKYRQQYVYCCPVHGNIVEPYYYAAFNIIDWTDIGKRIGDRIKPLSPNTTRRVLHGIDKHGDEPFIMHAAYGPEARGVIRPTTQPCFSQAIVQKPFIVNNQHSTGIDFRVKGTDKPLNTVPTQHGLSLVSPPPFIIKGEHTLQPGYVKPVNDTMQTQTVRQSMALITPPFLVANKGMSKSHSTTEPAGCFTTVAERGLITNEAWNGFIASYYNGSHCTQPVTGAIGTQSTHERSALVTYKKPNMEDCFYRMLKPKEIKLGMAFDQDYVVCGSGKDQVKQLGNAVTPPAMEWLVEQCINSLK